MALYTARNVTGGRLGSIRQNSAPLLVNTIFSLVFPCVLVPTPGLPYSWWPVFLSRASKLLCWRERLLIIEPLGQLVLRGLICIDSCCSTCVRNTRCVCRLCFQSFLTGKQWWSISSLWWLRSLFFLRMSMLQFYFPPWNYLYIKCIAIYSNCRHTFKKKPTLFKLSQMES